MIGYDLLFQSVLGYACVTFSLSFTVCSRSELHMRMPKNNTGMSSFSLAFYDSDF